MRTRFPRLTFLEPAPPFAAALLLLLAAVPARAADLYGKPLRGLSPVAVKDVVRDPALYAAKAVRVEGQNAGAAGNPALRDGDAVLPILSDGSFKLPASLAGGFLAAEGRARAEGKGAVFVATGVEVRGTEAKHEPSR